MKQQLYVLLAAVLLHCCVAASVYYVSETCDSTNVPSPCFSLSDFEDSASDFDDTIFYFTEGNHTLSFSIDIFETRNVTLQGLSLAVITCTVGSGFYIRNSTGVSFYNIFLRNCQRMVIIQSNDISLTISTFTVLTFKCKRIQLYNFFIDILQLRISIPLH